MTVDACPQCGAENHVPLAGGLLCLECRHEWNPADVDWSTLHNVGDAAREFAISAVLRKPADVIRAEDAQAVVDGLVGQAVRLEGGQWARIIEIVDDDTLTVELGDGRTETVTWSVVQSTTESRGSTAVVLEVSNDDAVRFANTAVQLAGLVLQAGAAAIIGTGDDVRIGDPPGGWLPTDADVMPMVEMGAAYAIAALAVALGIPRDEVERIANEYTNNAKQAGTE